MIGSLDPRKKKVSIVGAGISGLLVGYELKKRGFDVQIFEASSRAGGLLRTQKTFFGPSEKAAHSILVTPEVQKFFDELGVPLLAVSRKAKARFIVRNRKMRRMPLTPLEALQTAIRVFSKPRLTLPPSASLAEWCDAYLGAPARKYLLSPFVTGIFACTPEELNAKISFPKLVPTDPRVSLFRWMKSKPSHARRAKPQVMAPAKGMQSLVDALTAQLQNEIHFNSPIEKLNLDSDENWILTVPAPILASLIAPWDERSALALRQVRYSPLVSVSIFYRDEDFQGGPPRGIGVLIPRGEGYRILGCLFNSSAFPSRAQKGFVSLTTMIGGSSDSDALQLSDDEIGALVDRELRALLGARKAPAHVEIVRWPQAIPVYSNELKAAQEVLQEGFCAVPGRLVFSNFSKEVSIRGMIETLLKI